MINPPTVQLLIDAGFNDGWAIHGDKLVIWEHDVDPPAPLERPTNDVEQPA